ncbi:MAG TPA: M14 family zinc carboxypeptidase [Phototrophicaceae bacterium]|nr:M14 family zinc carboxypeptidase [Phototrophicaceae bacterium]
MDLKQIANDIPDYAVFMTIDELNASSHQLVKDFPELASIRVVGHTRKGDPIELLTIKGGEQQAFIFGGPHPNEPIGTMTIEYLSRKLCEDAALREELGYTWHFIKSIDSDGMRLNEGWFKGPYTPTNYARHYYRPEPAAQVEWTFPVDYKTLHFHKPLPETEALMRVIDEIKPRFMYSLHNAGFGGVYYYVSRACQPLYDLFHELPDWFGLTLDLGEPETSAAVELAPAIYKMLSAQDDYDHLEKLGIPDPASQMTAGNSSEAYARPYGTFSLVVEMPYYDEPRVNDQTVTKVTRRQALTQKLDRSDALGNWMESRLDKAQPYLRIQSSVRSAAETFVRLAVGWRDHERKFVETNPDMERLATQAELFSAQSAFFYQYLILGMFARLFNAEVAAGNTEPIIAEIAAEGTQKLADEGAAFEAELNYRALPIRGLVGVQVCAGLATADYLRNTVTAV